MTTELIKPDGRTPCQRAVKYYIAALMLGLPLIVTDAYFNITETKSIYFHIISIILIVFSAFFSEKKPKEEKLPLLQRLGLSLTDKGMIAFIAVLFVCSFFSKYPADVWLGLYARYQGFFPMLVYAVIYFIVSRGYTSSESFVHFSILGFTAVCILGIVNCFNIDPFQFYEGININYRKMFLSTIGNINFYSSYMCLLMPVVVCGFCQSNKKVNRIIYTAALIIGSWGMMLTASESFALGFAFSLMIMPMFFYSRLDRFRKYLLSIVIMIISAQLFNIPLSHSGKANIPLSFLLSVVVNPFVSAAIILLCLFAYLFALKFPNKMRFFKRIYPILLVIFIFAVIACFFISNTSGLGALDAVFEIDADWGTQRGKIWRFCLKAFRDDYSLKEILIGTGPETLQRLTASANLFHGKSLDQAHNEYLQYLMTTGVLGLGAYLGLIGTVIYTVLKKLKNNALAVALFAALVSYWVQASVNIAQPFTTPIVYVYIACIAGIYKMNNAKS